MAFFKSLSKAFGSSDGDGRSAEDRLNTAAEEAEKEPAGSEDRAGFKPEPRPVAGHGHTHNDAHGHSHLQEPRAEKPEARRAAGAVKSGSAGAKALPLINVPPDYTQDDLLRVLTENKGSDLHISVGDVPLFRIHGRLHRSDTDIITQERAEELLYPLVDDERIDIFEQCGNLDFSYELPGVARFRGNYFKQKNGMAAVFREIPDRIPTIDEMKLPQILKKIAMFKHGIVVVTGPTGSGKSTTLAAMLDHVNKNRSAHVITIEDPVEFTHRNNKCIIDHREVGTQANSFADALRASLREDPDIILVGEMRDLDTIYNAIKAAETGALVFATLHTNSAAKTIDRMIDVFPPKQQEAVRAMLSESMKAVIAQLLLQRKDGTGRIAVHEILIAESGFANLIREGKTSQINNYIQTGKDIGMQTMDTGLLKLLKEGSIDIPTAREVCHDPNFFKNYGFDLSR